MSRKKIEAGKRGRPPSSNSGVPISGHVPAEMRQELEQIAEREERSLSQALVRVLRVGLEHYPTAKAGK